MIEHASGNLLEADVEALVNSVNTVGVMGKGIALQFKQAFPANYDAYRRACAHGDVRPGSILVHDTGFLTNPRYILNFPTKRHWRGKSRLPDVESGLAALVDVVRRLEIRSIALPPLGCGNGGLAWNKVLPRVEAAFQHLPDVRVLVYAPDGAPSPGAMPVTTKKPRLTPARAALLGVLQAYALPGYTMGMLEVQKLAYFLQAAGEPMQLRFVRDRYGPYAEPLHFVLQRLEGHYIRGYGDRSTDVSIMLREDAAPAIDFALRDRPETRDRLLRVASTIGGFETPYGLELLATVHRVADDDPAARTSADATIRDVHAWSERKRQRFSAQHVRVAWDHLHRHGWL